MLDNKPKQYLQLTIKDLVEFIWTNKKKDAFVNWSKDELAVYLARKQTGYIVATDIKGITGVCVYEERCEGLVYILQVLTTTRSAIRSFAREFRKIYPGWTIEARRHGKVRRYLKTDKLISRLIHQQ